MTIPARTLTNPKTFLIEVGGDGFNAYTIREDGEREIFAASSAMSTFLRVCETMLGGRVALAVVVPEVSDVK